LTGLRVKIQQMPGVGTADRQVKEPPV